MHRRYALQMLVGLLVVGAAGEDLQSAPKKQKTITLHEIKCYTTETVTGPDELYFLVNDSNNRVKFNSLNVFSGTKPLNDDQVWKLNQTFTVDADAVIIIQLFDRDTGVNNYAPLLDALADAAAEGAKAVGPKNAKVAAAAAATSGITRVLAAVGDVDDRLLFLCIPADEKAPKVVYRDKGGVWVLGSNFDYELTYSVTVK